ncbi:MAG: hypothetical protein IJ334_07715, partial [Clostridia bacterium]|nr:hypothetical protein [Clostridia bacterium]
PEISAEKYACYLHIPNLGEFSAREILVSKPVVLRFQLKSMLAIYIYPTLENFPSGKFSRASRLS